MDTLHYAPGLEWVKPARVWQNFAGKMVTITVSICVWVTVLVGVDPVDC
jgi:hypothetical protein